MKITLAAALAAALTVAGTPGGAPADPVHGLQTDGRWLRDAHGRVVLVHGMNMIWKHAPYVPPDAPEGFTAADADWLVEHGFNAARIGTLWTGVSPDAPGVIDHDYLDDWDRIVQLLAERGIYVLFDFHQDMFNQEYQGEGIPEWARHAPLTDPLPRPFLGFPANYFTPQTSEAFDNLWANANGVAWDGFRDAWKAVAARWEDLPTSMGYDLLNEPHSGLEWPLCIFPPQLGCPESTYTDEIQPFFEHALAGIREVDDDNIVWFEPQIFAGGTGGPTHFQPVEGEDQLGYSFHIYCPHGALLQAMQIPFSPPGCASFERDVLTQAHITADRIGAARVMTEFGASDDLADIAGVAALADEFFTGWTYWHYKNWGDPTTQSQTSGAQGMFEDDADLSTLKLDKANIVVRTYPRATAGTPIELFFDPADGTFVYTYEPDTTSAPTEIFVSPLHYPDGYVAGVIGGTIDDVPGNLLLVEADPDADEVAVFITRAS